MTLHTCIAKPAAPGSAFDRPFRSGRPALEQPCVDRPSAVHHRSLSLWLLALLLSWLGANPLAAADKAPAAAPAVKFEDFKIVYERNMFSPSRRSQRPGAVQFVRPKKVEGCSLVGTMIYEKGSYAFFNGSEAKYRTAVTVSNTLAGLKLIDITPNSVKFSSASNILELTMDKQLKREDEGEWQLVTGAGSWDASAASSSDRDRSSDRDQSSERDRSSRRDRSGRDSSSSVSGGATGSSGGSASAEEVLKRLMQRREQEK
jgi:hypothetical protein